ncbi:sugar transporter [Aspergillus taichungensis]|uniref:Sugar transporter n=1 Tax=Aspergillus taichungensis TaxID=482145 RepID=A0A2J5HH44_9EURO|nr:sugar transporter [Aspergillus taichungensis]
MAGINSMYGRGLGLRMAILFTCQVAFILFGYNQGVFSGIVRNEEFLSLLNYPSSAVLGIIVAIYNLGCLFGTVVAFVVSDKLGFRKTMWFSMAWILIGASLQACSYSQAQLLVSRFISGTGTGIMSVAAPVYQSELCEAKNRGMYVCSQPLAIGVGIVISYWFDYGMSYVAGSVSWRLPIAFQSIFAIVVVIMVRGLPESPRWLYRWQRPDEALQVLCDVHDRAADDPKIVEDSRGMYRAVELDKLREEYKWSRIFKKDELQTGRRVLLSYGLQFMNQMTGINFIVTYVTSVLETNVGLDKQLSLLLGGVIQVMFVIGSIYPTMYSDRLGRRRPMMWGCFGLFLCMMMISILLSFKGSSIEKPAATASIVFFFLFMLIFGASINCIPWVYSPELLPLHVRAKGQAIAISASWLWNFFVAMIAPTLIKELVWKGYLIFMCMNLIFIPIVYFFYPETANLTLEEIDYLFMDGSQPDSQPDLHPDAKEPAVREVQCTA